MSHSGIGRKYKMLTDDQRRKSQGPIERTTYSLGNKSKDRKRHFGKSYETGICIYIGIQSVCVRPGYSPGSIGGCPKGKAPNGNRDVELTLAFRSKGRMIMASKGYI